PRGGWTAAVDLNPLEATDAEEMRWLESLIWPGRNETARQERLRAATQVAVADPPYLVKGDLTQVLPQLAAQAPRQATLVVFHSAVLVYVDRQDRREVVQEMSELPGDWVYSEGGRVLPDQQDAKPQVPTHFTLGLDGQVVGHTGEHGQSVSWL